VTLHRWHRIPPPLLLPPLLLSLLLLPLLAGCERAPQSRDDSADRTLPFVFRSLNLRQQDRKGRPGWELTSPEARYDLRRRVAQARSPRGVIYKEGKPIYRLEAASGTVLNDGEVILLEGRIRVQQLGKQPVLIKASRVRWMPGQQRMEIDRHPEAFDRHSRLFAQTARFLLDRNQLELRGKPELHHWSQSFDPFKEVPRGAPEVVVKVSRADWEPGTGWLEAKGPVLATRRSPGTAANQPPQTLSASALAGNTIKQEYSLSEPVRFHDPQEQGSLEARNVSIDLPQKRIHTDTPFRAQRGNLQASGAALVLEGSRDTVVIPAGCALDRPGESLRAQSCSWNWKSQDVQAEGAMELRREANRQITRGQLLRGTLGNEGQIEVTSPGGRVFSQFQVPRRSGPPKPSPPRPRPEPIRL
jgi:LPS export ABC transporter protein LptC